MHGRTRWTVARWSTVVVIGLATAGCGGGSAEAEAREQALRVGDAARVTTEDRAETRKEDAPSDDAERRRTLVSSGDVDSRVDEPRERREFGARDDSDDGRGKKKRGSGKKKKRGKGKDD